MLLFPLLTTAFSATTTAQVEKGWQLRRPGDPSSVGGGAAAQKAFHALLGTWANAILAWYSTVGAGDTFIAGMLFGLMCHPLDWDTERKLRFAVQVATRKVQEEGLRLRNMTVQDMN